MLLVWLSGPSFCEESDLTDEPIGIHLFGIQVFRQPLLDFGMTFMAGVADCFDEFGITPGAADIFRRAASAYLNQARIAYAGLRIGEPLDLERVFPAIAEVVEVSQGTL